MMDHPGLCPCDECVEKRAHTRELALGRESRFGLARLTLTDPIERNPLTHHGTARQRRDLDDFETA